MIRTFLLGLSLLLTACGAPSALQLSASEPRSWLIENVHVLDMETGEFSAPQSVRIEDGEIVARGAGLLAINVERIDGAGGYLIPGLIDMHVHLLDENDLAADLIYGVTTVRNMGGMPFHLPMADRIAAGTLLGPRLISTGAILNNPDTNSVHGLQTLVATAEEARAAVRHQYEAGYRDLKLYTHLSRETFSAIRDEAGRLGMTLSGHPVEGLPDDPMDISETLAAHFVTIEHAESIVYHALRDEPDMERARALAQQFAAAGARVAPTLIVHHNLARIVETRGGHLERPDMAMFNPVMYGFEADKYAFWSTFQSDNRTRMQALYEDVTRLMHEAGVELVVGTDAGVMVTPHGVSVCEEIELLVARAGVTPFEALQAATTNPAGALGLGGEIGRVEAGYRADLVLLPANPLADLTVLRTPTGVMRDGVWLDDERLDALRIVAEHPSRLRTWPRLIHHILTR